MNVRRTILIIATILACVGHANAQSGLYRWKSEGNPIITHLRTADPSCHVWEDGRLWVYASHDQPDATDYASMDGYHVFSTDDLKNWVDHGQVLHSRDVSWGIEGGGWMWAPDCAYKDGKYYFYFPHKNKQGQWRTGVAVSDYPQGPFTDIGRPIEGTTGTDPMCFVDDDGQAYLYFGHGKVARLKENMTELAESPRDVDYGADNFGEGIYMHKRNGIYYFSYTEFTAPVDQAYYSMGDNPYGPFEFKGAVGKRGPGAQDHHSMVEFRGQWYYFYHVGNYKGNNGNRRNVCADSLFYNEDGTMQMVEYTSEGIAPDPIGMAPANVIPGEFSAADYYMQTGTQSGNHKTVEVSNGDQLVYVLSIQYPYAYQFEMLTESIQNDGEIILTVDDELVKTMSFQQGQKSIYCKLNLHKGTHALHIVFKSSLDGSLMKLKTIEIASDTEHHKITANRAEGGLVTPQGIQYYKTGSTINYEVEPNKYYIIEDVLVNGKSVGEVDEYAFSNLQTDQSITPVFSPCETEVEILAKVNDEAAKGYTELFAEPESSIQVLAKTEEQGKWNWRGPNNFSSENKDFEIAIAPNTIGSYELLFTNDAGCKTDYKIKIAAKRDVIEAEDFVNQKGIQTEGTTDFWGGKNIGFIEHGDWIEYALNIEKAGIYEVRYRVACTNSGSNIEFVHGDKTLATTKLANTGGWQNWKTSEPIQVKLPEGKQNIKLVFKGGSGFLFNMNWFRLDQVND